MKKSIKYFRPLYVLLLLLVTFTVLAIGLILSSSFHSSSNTPILMLKLNTANDEKTLYRKLLVNGELDKGKKFKVKNEEIVDASDIFIDHVNRKSNSIYLTVKKHVLKDQFKKQVHNPIYDRMIKQVVKEQQHPIFVFTMFKTKNHYYAYLALNAGIDDTGTIYRYSKKDKKMSGIGQTSNDEHVVAIREITR